MSYDYKLFDGAKAIPFSQLPPEAWRAIVGHDAGIEDMRELRRSVPWLFRGINLRSGAISSLPFAIMDGDNEYDTSDDYQNRLGWLPNPGAILGLTEASLTLTGRAYQFVERNRMRYLTLRYLTPNSVHPKIDRLEGLTGFKRQVGGESRDLAIEDVVHFWLPDEFVELGPPETSPGMAASAAAGVLMNMDEFEALFFKRGAIRATILAVPRGTKKDERDRLKSWWKRVVSGVQNSFATEVVAADEVKPTVVGEGVKELANVELTKEKREDISTALGIPQSLLFSSAANYATARQDDLHFMGKTVRNEARFIQDVWNEQLFAPLGLRWEFRFESMEIFQEEEVERSAAYVNLVRGKTPPVLAMQILGYDLPANMTWEEFEAKIIEWETQMSAFRPAPTFGLVEDDRNPERANRGETPQRSVLEAWERHAIKQLKAGKAIKGTPGAAPFNHEDKIDRALAASLGASLAAAKTAEDVRRIFHNAAEWEDYP
jgi:HK97 family phage portal protein